MEIEPGFCSCRNLVACGVLVLVTVLASIAQAQESLLENPQEQDKPKGKLQEPADPGEVPAERSDPHAAPSLRHPRIRLRGGAWMVPDFNANIPGGLRSFTGRLLPVIAPEVSVPLGPVFASGAVEYASTNDLSLQSFSLSVGTAMPLGEALGAPLDLEVSGGAFWAEFEVDEGRFGDFDPGAGVFGRADLGIGLGKNWRASLWSDLRWAEFDFKRTVVSGDDEAGGLMIVAGLSVSLGF